METVISASEEKVVKSFHKKNDLQKSKTETIQHETDHALQKNFSVVDLWKIRSMKKYFNYN